MKGSLNSELIPRNHKIKLDQAKKDINAQIDKLSGISGEDARLQFLNEIFKQETFGSTFVDCKQTTDKGLPNRIIVAINKKGVSVVHPESKDVLITHGFAKISNWSCGETYFSMSTGSLVRGSKMVCETTLGYKMENLVSSYIQYIHTNIQKTTQAGNF